LRSVSGAGDAKVHAAAVLRAEHSAKRPGEAIVQVVWQTGMSNSSGGRGNSTPMLVAAW
jgi:hypothetical protein